MRMKAILDKYWVAYIGTSYTHSKETGKAVEKREESRGPLGVEAPESCSAGQMHAPLTLTTGALCGVPVWCCPSLAPTFSLP